MEQFITCSNEKPLPIVLCRQSRWKPPIAQAKGITKSALMQKAKAKPSSLTGKAGHESQDEAPFSLDSAMILCRSADYDWWQTGSKISLSGICVFFMLFVRLYPCHLSYLMVKSSAMPEKRGRGNSNSPPLLPPQGLPQNEAASESVDD